MERVPPYLPDMGPLYCINHNLRPIVTRYRMEMLFLSSFELEAHIIAVDLPSSYKSFVFSTLLQSRAKLSQGVPNLNASFP